MYCPWNINDGNADVGVVVGKQSMTVWLSRRNTVCCLKRIGDVGDIASNCDAFDGWSVFLPIGIGAVLFHVAVLAVLSSTFLPM